MFSPHRLHVLELTCDTHQEAMDFIKKQELGWYEIRKFYEVVGE